MVPHVCGRDPDINMIIFGFFKSYPHRKWGCGRHYDGRFFSMVGTLLGHLPFTNTDISIYIIPLRVIQN